MAGGVTLNPAVLGSISGAGLILKTYSEVKNYKRKIEMCKFAYTTYEKVLTHLRSFMRGLEYNEKEFLDHVKVLDEMMGIPYKNIPISKSKKTLAFYDQYWASIMSLIGDKIKSIIE